ncbi:putative membrane protein [Devosia sp. YR412]|uniref:DUF4142 domain-containing protein n=1 Tax=Devosia sp. YR412 TaxID=1881030 RepID=UPI0008C006A5|nr:DUF4142 domain-containing protein [Devosia sp. YR412]SEP81880.1 putative membrane protein [Devosia sp. YR412]
MDRRVILTGVAMTIASPLILRTAAFAAMIDPSAAKTEADFRNGVIGPAELSLATSKIAVEKATNEHAKIFAGYELAEAMAVTEVLRDLGTEVPEMDEKAKATLAKIEAASGADFDIAYIQAQLENHEYLRDLAEGFLANSSADNTDMAEMHGRHLATLSHAVFKEHVDITTRILAELKA